jgi:hypothetical protein
MDKNREEEIRKRAEQIWQDEGQPEGREAQHWAQAERELELASRQGSETGNETGFAEGSKTERVAEDLKSGKGARRS